MGLFLRYTALRLLLLVAVAGVLVLLGVRGPLLVVLAVLISAALSYVLLSGPRNAVVRHLEQRAAARRAAADPDAAAEDAEDEAVRRREEDLPGGR